MKQILNHILSFAITATLLVGVVACGSAKGSSGKQYSSESSIGKTLDEKFTDLTESYQDWSDISVPVKIELQSPKNLTVSGKAVMVRNESIKISVRILGMELAVLFIDNDNLYVVDRLNHMYYQTPISVLEEAAGLNLADIQSLLLGQAFVPGSGTISSGERNSFNLEAKEGSEWTITPRKTIDGMTWHYNVFTPEIGAPFIESLVIKPQDYAPLTATFSNHVVTTAGNIAQAITVDGKMKGRDILLTLSLQTGKARWNQGLSIVPFSVPSNYKRIETGSVIDMLKHL